MLAYACSPLRGSEPGLGWWRAFEAAKYFDVTVICKKQTYEKDIRTYYAEKGEVPGLRFRFLPNTKLERVAKRVPGLFYLAYNLWHRRAYRLALELREECNFDLVHQANWVTFREPGYLWKMDLPFVWGPVGGTEKCPWNFLPQLGFLAALQEGPRNLLNSIQFRASRRLRKAARRAVVLVTANSDGQHAFRKTHNIDSVRLLQVGITSLGNERSSEYDGRRPIHLLWSGRFATNKGLHLLFMALREVPATVRYELRILGSGPMEKSWRKLSRRYGLDEHCTWMGTLPYDSAMRQFDWADLYAFTSLRDAGATVVVESLAHGVPVICLDHSGGRDVVTEHCGVKIPISSPGEAIRVLRDTIVRLAGDDRELRTLSRGAFERAKEYFWTRNGERMAEVYHRALTAATSPGESE